MTDLISRQAVYDILQYECSSAVENYLRPKVEKIPSAIPTPHGNLVDIDAMIDRFWDGDHMEIHCRDLDDIPIIVEAEAEHE